MASAAVVSPAALLVIVTTGVTGGILTTRAQDELDRTMVQVDPPLQHLSTFRSELAQGLTFGGKIAVTPEGLQDHHTGLLLVLFWYVTSTREG